MVINVGDKIEVYWPLEDKYGPETVATYDTATVFHGLSYDDGDSENLNMEQENWLVVQSNQANIAGPSSVHNEALEVYFKTLAHKQFMLHHAEGLPPHPKLDSYKEE